MRNIQAILAEAGADFSNVVKANCHLLDMADFAAFNETYAKSKEMCCEIFRKKPSFSDFSWCQKRRSLSIF